MAFKMNEMNDYEEVYGSHLTETLTLKMCGGCKEWWNYQVEFEYGQQIGVYKRDKDGLHQLDGKLVMNEEGNVKLVDEDYYELKEDESYLMICDI